MVRKDEYLNSVLRNDQKQSDTEKMLFSPEKAVEVPHVFRIVFSKSFSDRMEKLLF